MFEALGRIPDAELARRHTAVKAHLAELEPEASGLLIFSRLSIYYLSGTWANGVLWIPKEGQPILMLRKGINRARLESPLPAFSFKSYSSLPVIAEEAECPFGRIVAVESTGLTWQLGQMLQSRLTDYEFRSGDHAIALSRMVKSEYELSILRLTGERHHHTLYNVMPERIRPGMSERDISVVAWDVFFAHGHQGLLRMQAQGEECFLGHVSAGDSGNYPSVFNGPLGLRGVHPAMPVMGYAGKLWNFGEPLGLDIGFVTEGYHTDKTQTYWAGPASSIPDEVRRAHDFCVDMQNWVAENAKPGVTPEALYLHCVGQAEARGFAEGFMGLGENKVPFIGHGIGLTIDEFPAIANKFRQPLQEGMVIAVEPKQGVPGIGMVGVENTFEITAEGAKCITGDNYDIICVE